MCPLLSAFGLRFAVDLRSGPKDTKAINYTRAEQSAARLWVPPDRARDFDRSGQDPGADMNTVPDTCNRRPLLTGRFPGG